VDGPTAFDCMEKLAHAGDNGVPGVVTVNTESRIPYSVAIRFLLNAVYLPILIQSYKIYREGEVERSLKFRLSYHRDKRRNSHQHVDKRRLQKAPYDITVED
jgi:hypothetical protein